VVRRIDRVGRGSGSFGWGRCRAFPMWEARTGHKTLTAVRSLSRSTEAGIGSPRRKRRHIKKRGGAE
jgi:hypothetical protein